MGGFYYAAFRSAVHPRTLALTSERVVPVVCPEKPALRYHPETMPDQTSRDYERAHSVLLQVAAQQTSDPFSRQPREEKKQKLYTPDSMWEQFAKEVRALSTTGATLAHFVCFSSSFLT